ncbi:NADPH:quinone reductase and related Zn-dependent oxidoreductases [Thiohalobacter thiocyanaticus]|uniref:NADPH:quinone reductase and related Zn-dependent oxidoreductases n=1 Tax=Thiohalobacter thiocyanaticus TaxID=585455 RepID=A0A1Z4VMW3_9GAMM|nr:NADPH:quinone reductase and related Zn-dependent oxidoreductases [Thiohalobacter thiocyanaticus]
MQPGVGDAGIGQDGLVELGGFRVGHQGIACLAVGGAVELLAAQASDVLEFKLTLETVQIGGAVTQPGAQSEGVGLLAQTLFIDIFITRANLP